MMKKAYALLLIFILAGCTATEYRQLIDLATSNDPKSAVKTLTQQKGQQYLSNPNSLIHDVKKLEDIANAFANLRKAIVNSWGEDDAKEPSAKEYVKYCNGQQKLETFLGSF